MSVGSVDHFVHGCNYPWSTDGQTVYYALDFGANLWGSHLGVSTRRERIARDFADMAALGFRVARWFVFGDGRSGIVYDGAGWPAALDPHVFTDLDAAIGIAHAVGMQLDLVLLDHRWCFAGVRETLADPVSGALLGASLPAGRTHILRESRGQERLFAHVIEPIVERYGHAGVRADLGAAVWGYELMNEPDFVVEEWERDRGRSVREPLPFAAVADAVAWLSEVVHAHSSSLVTIGCARSYNLWAWDDDRLDLDLLQLHSYPDVRWAHDVDVFGRHVSELGVRRPVLLGEFPGDGPRQHPCAARPPATTLDEYLAFALDAGYVGAWPWSFSGTDAYGRVPAPPLLRFARRHPHLVNPRCAAPSAG